MGVLLPYQQAWVADTSPVRVVEKSRRVGLSWAEAANSALQAAKAGGQDTWYIGYNKDMALEFIRDCAFWAKHFQLAASAMEQEVLQDETGDILAFKITFASGHRVTALSSRPSNLRGKQGRVIIDEAAFHPDLPGLIKAALALLIWGGSVSIISTHNGVDNAFNELISEVRAGKKPYSLHRIPFDEAVAQGLCKQVFQATGKPWSNQAERDWCEEIRAFYRPNDAEELDCIPSQSGGQYLSRALIEARMSPLYPVLRYTCDDAFAQQPDDVRQRSCMDWMREHLDKLVQVQTVTAKHQRHFYGWDFGRSGDLSVFFPLVESSALKLTAPFVIELRNVPFRQQEQLLFYLVDRLPRFSGGAHDARGNGQFLAEVAAQRYGTAVQQVMLSRQWYLEHMPPLKARFEDDEITLPRDGDLLDDLRAIVVDKGVPMVSDARSAGRDGKQRHGDAAIALALALYAVKQAAAPMEFEQFTLDPSPTQRSHLGALA